MWRPILTRAPSLAGKKKKGVSSRGGKGLNLLIGYTGNWQDLLRERGKKEKKEKGYFINLYLREEGIGWVPYRGRQGGGGKELGPHFIIEGRGEERRSHFLSVYRGTWRGRTSFRPYNPRP